MPRKSTGTVRVLRYKKTGARQWHAKWTRADGTRSDWLPLPAPIQVALCCEIAEPECEHRRQARALAARMASKVHAASQNNGTGETVAEWFKRLHAAKEQKGLSTVDDMRGRARKWILPDIEHKAMTSVTREDIEAIVYRLDSAVAAFQKHGPGKGRLSPSTAANVWGDLAHAFDEAVSAKDPGLRVLTSNPTREVRPPDAGTEREGQILYSDELVTLLRGVPVDPDATPVPLYRRQVYAMAVYTKARSSELEALTASDVDLIHGTISIEKQADKKSKGRAGIKATKTKRARTIDIEQHLRPLLEHLVAHPAGKRGRLLHMPPPEDRPELLRRDLVHVGVTRKALHIEGDPMRRGIVFHDLRDTGLTHMAVRGNTPIEIQWAGGHTDFKTTQGYIDRGRVEARRIGEPLPPLPPEVLPGIAPESPRGDSKVTKKPKTSRFVATPPGIEPGLPA